MARKRRTPAQIITKPREVKVALSRGQTVASAVRQTGVTEQAYYRWRSELGGLGLAQVNRLTQLELENTRLK